MTNEEKAIEIAKKHHEIYDDYYDSIQECIESALEMAHWKDDQLKDYINGAIEIAEKENCTIMVNLFNEIIKDLGL